jgi:hypothetical protein
MSKEIELTEPFHGRRPGTDGFMVELFQVIKEKLTLIFLNASKNLNRANMA